MSLFKRTPQGSVFVKLDENRIRLKEARGRIAAIDAAHEALGASYAELQKETLRVHTNSEGYKTQLESLLANL